MEGVLLCLVGAVGLVGNATAIAVFSRQRVQRNFHALMVGLALFDATYIIMRYCYLNLRFLQGDHSGCAKPTVDSNPYVAF